MFGIGYFVLLHSKTLSSTRNLLGQCVWRNLKKKQQQPAQSIYANGCQRFFFNLIYEARLCEQSIKNYATKS